MRTIAGSSPDGHLTQIAAILAAGILRLRAKQALEVPAETVLSVYQELTASETGETT